MHAFPLVRFSGIRFVVINLIGFRASCNHCGETILHSRLICSDCTTGCWSNSVDLCADCWKFDCYRESDNKRHISTHMLIQVRRPVSQLEYYGLFEDAKRVVKASVETMSTVSELSCALCENVIPEKPYWCCLACCGTFGTS